MISWFKGFKYHIKSICYCTKSSGWGIKNIVFRICIIEKG